MSHKSYLLWFSQSTHGETNRAFNCCLNLVIVSTQTFSFPFERITVCIVPHWSFCIKVRGFHSSFFNYNLKFCFSTRRTRLSAFWSRILFSAELYAVKINWVTVSSVCYISHSIYICSAQSPYFANGSRIHGMSPSSVQIGTAGVKKGYCFGRYAWSISTEGHMLSATTVIDDSNHLQEIGGMALEAGTCPHSRCSMLLELSVLTLFRKAGFASYLCCMRWLLQQHIFLQYGK